MLHESRDDDLWDECAHLRLGIILEGLLYCNDGLDTTAVHELHDQVDEAFLVEDTVVLDERRECFVQHIKLVVELVALVFVVKVYYLQRERAGKFESAFNANLTYFNGNWYTGRFMDASHNFPTVTLA